MPGSTAARRPALGTALDRFQEAQDCAGGDAGPLRLRVMPGVGHHDDLRAKGAGDPVALRLWVREVGVLLAHHDQGGGRDIGQPRLRRVVASARGGRERLRVSRPAKARHDLVAVLAEIRWPPAGVRCAVAAAARSG